MRVLFLDFDGVLKRQNAFHWWEDCCSRLNRVIAATDCKIVVSSNWRHIYPTLPELSAILSVMGIPARAIFDRTPFADERRIEVRKWLEQHTSIIESYAIIDDAFGLTCGMTRSRLVVTDPQYGMQTEHADELIRLLLTPALRLGG